MTGYGEDGRGGVFRSRNDPQLRLVPLRLDRPLQLKFSKAGDLLVTLTRDERGSEIANLWFCRIGGAPALENWMKVA